MGGMGAGREQGERDRERGRRGGDAPKKITTAADVTAATARRRPRSRCRSGSALNSLGFGSNSGSARSGLAAPASQISAPAACRRPCPRPRRLARLRHAAAAAARGGAARWPSRSRRRSRKPRSALVSGVRGGAEISLRSSLWPPAPHPLCSGLPLQLSRCSANWGLDSGNLSCNHAAHQSGPQRSIRERSTKP